MVGETKNEQAPLKRGPELEAFCDSICLAISALSREHQERLYKSGLAVPKLSESELREVFLTITDAVS